MLKRARVLGEGEPCSGFQDMEAKLRKGVWKIFEPRQMMVDVESRMLEQVPTL